MLQRIQTIFLFMAMLAGLSLLIDPMTLASVEGDVDVLKSQPQSMLEDGIFHVTDHLILLLLVGLTSFLALVDIFQFRNRQRQVALAVFRKMTGITKELANYRRIISDVRFNNH